MTKEEALSRIKFLSKEIEIHNHNYYVLSQPSIGDYEFECGEFDYEFNLGYDNKLELSDLQFNDHYNLAEAVMKGITNHFKVEKDD